MTNKKPWTRNQKLQLAGIIVLVLLLIATPLWNDIYSFIKQKSYLTLREKYSNLVKVFSDKTSILAVRPLYLLPYRPNRPQAESQTKGLILAEVKIKNKKLANSITVEFIVDFGRGQKHSSTEWNIVAKQKSLIFSMFYPDIKFISWSPDIPNDIKEIAENHKNPCTLQLVVTWEDIDKKMHKLESYSELRYDDKSGVYYFDERENKLLF